MKNFKYKNEITALFATCGFAMLLGLIWMLLELIFYGVVTDRIVDNIMMCLMGPFIYNAVLRKIEKEREKEEKSA